MGTESEKQSNPEEDQDSQVTKLAPASPIVQKGRTAFAGDFDHVVNQFVQEIDSLAGTLPLAQRVIGFAHRTANQDFKQFTEKYKQQDGKMAIPPGNILEFRRLHQKVRQSNAARDLVPRSFLVALVSQYDYFLGLLIETLLLTKPELIDQSDKQLSFSDLVQFGSIEAARDHVIEKEVESILRKSHSEQFDWLETTFGVPLRKGLAVWPCFIEITERRNLFVHTGGQVSAQYLKVCLAHKSDCGGAKRGDRLRVDPSYFKRAHEVIFEVGVKLAHVFWRKLRPEERPDADRNLISITYNLLCDGRYVLAQAITDFSLEEIKKHSSEQFRLRFIVNRAQAYKWGGNEGRALEILKSVDFSALSADFKLADATLRGDFDFAIKLARTIGKEGDVRLEDYREWPLFRELRKYPPFQEAVLEIFGEPLNRVSTDGNIDEGSQGNKMLLDPTGA